MSSARSAGAFSAWCCCHERRGLRVVESSSGEQNDDSLSIQANVTISGSSTKLIKNGVAPLPFPLPALLKQSWYIKRGERVRVRGYAPFYATLGCTKLSALHA